MSGKLILSFLIVLISFGNIFPQKAEIDSLKKVIEKGDDTTKLKALLKLCTHYTDINLKDAQQCMKRIDSLNAKINKPKFKGLVLHNKGTYYFKTGEYNKAMEAFNRSLKIYQELDLDYRIASAYNDIGLFYEKRGDYDKALTYLIKALKIWEELNLEKNLVKAYLNIGLVHFRNQNYQKAEEYYQKSLKIRKKLNDKKGIALVYNNLAIVYYYIGKYEHVRNYFEKAHKIYKEIGNIRKQAMTLSNLGEIYFHIGKHDKALDAYRECIQIEKKLKDRSGVARSYVMISEVLKARESYDRAITYLDSAMRIAEEIKEKNELRDIYDKLSSNYKAKGNFKEALYWREKYMALHDSIFNETKTQQLNELQTKYETEKKEQKIELLNKEKKLQEYQIKKQRYFVIFISLIALIVLTFAIIVLMQKKKLTRAHRKLAKQQKQITDSIEYASRIQNAILPTHNRIQTILKQDYFIFFRPKEVVSGDFYFADQKNNKKIIAAIDCTGHGVPGAFMSMLGYSFLSQIISNKGIIQADEILNKLREYIIQALHQKQEIGYSKDGMDISLCIIDEEEKKIEFAGAYHYLLLIRNEQVTRYSGDKMPIGIHYKQKAHFSKTEISYEKGDTIYLFSDGLIDQFGGENGKKFRLKNFQDLLVTIQDESMIRQKEILEQSLDNWKSTYEQVDDILVMGIKL